MSSVPTHISGPVYLSHDRDHQCSFDSKSETLSAEWFASLFDGLDVLSEELAARIAATSEYRTDIRLAVGDRFISDAFFYDRAFAIPESGRDAIRRFVDAVTAVALEHDTIWATDESNLGQPESLYLALTNTEDVPRYIRYLESCDLDHEVDHGFEICSVVREHGWTPETVALWVARCGTCAGQHGHESEWEAPSGETIEDWAKGSTANRDLLVRLLAANLLHMLNWQEPELVFMQEALEEDGVDIFFNPEKLEPLGLGSSSEAVVGEALAAAKATVAVCVEEKRVPKHWLAALAS